MLEFIMELFEGGFDSSILPPEFQMAIAMAVLASGAMMIFSYILYLIDALAGFTKSLLHLK